MRTLKSDFPKGFESWQETHFEIVSIILKQREMKDSDTLKSIEKSYGTNSLYNLAQVLTDEFEENYNKGNNVFDAINNFINEKLK